jgi:fatty acid desaturase
MTRPMSRSRRLSQLEWPTLLVAGLVYGGWLAVTWWHAHVPWWALFMAGGWFTAWHGSLQHETIHGHPTGIRSIDDAIGAIPLSLWLPYSVYRRSHLAHHAAHVVTDPFDDPESRYRAITSNWRDRIGEGLDRCEATLAGRLALGPVICMGRFLTSEAIRAWRTPGESWKDWRGHLLGVAAILSWLRYCHFPLASYILLFLYPGTALTLLRSFAEHRAGPTSRRRVAVVESKGLFALLFLNNNLHAAHHRAAHVAWYRLPALYRTSRDALLAGNDALVYAGYRDVARRYLLTPHDDLIHPDYRGMDA